MQRAPSERRRSFSERDRTEQRVLARQTKRRRRHYNATTSLVRRQPAPRAYAVRYTAIPHGVWDCASCVVVRRLGHGRLSGLSRRRSRVRVPSLALIRAANLHLAVSSGEGRAKHCPSPSSLPGLVFALSASDFIARAKFLPFAAAMSEYVVVFERAEDGGWGAYLPDLPGVVALGATRDDVSERIHEAVDAYAQEMAALGQPLPEPVAATGTIQAA
jgi:predicted RNase H-like HicB family nuclease